MILQNIHNMVMSLNFTAIEVKTINSVESWEGGVLVAVSGSVKTKEFSVRRSFMQTFFLAPQEKGYFVLNDIFQFIDEGTVFYRHGDEAQLILQTLIQNQNNLKVCSSLGRLCLLTYFKWLICVCS